MSPMRAFWGKRLRLIWSDSLSAPNSSSSMHVSTTSKKIGGSVGARVIVYSKVLNCGC